MEYYFNELSIVDISSSQQDIHQWATKFAQTCVKAKKYGFKALRTSIYFSEIEIVRGEYKLSDWIKDRSSGDRDLKRRFRSFTTNIMPLINSDDEVFPQFEFAIFKVEENEALGLGAAYLKQSLAISFPTTLLWEELETPLQYEYIDENESEETIISEVFTKNISTPENLELHKDFIIKRLTIAPVPLDWNPTDNYLPNVETSNEILDIDSFYENNRQGSRGERIAKFRVLGSQVAEINHYEFNKVISDKNKTTEKLRDIYQSKNTTGRTVYLSIDFEKGAFEVCDDGGVHIEEILFNGNSNGSQELDHSIRL